MMDYYQILGVEKTATQTEIKKAYRELAQKYHPDKCPGDKTAEETFKKVADAYSILGDDAKRKEYDAKSQRGARAEGFGFGFDEFVRDFGNNPFRERNQFNFRTRQHSQKSNAWQFSTEHLDITLSSTISLADAISGKKIQLAFSRRIIDYTGKNGDLVSFTKKEEEKEIQVTIDLKRVYLLIKQEGGRVSSKLRVAKMGHEDMHTYSNAWGEITQAPLSGDLIIDVVYDLPEGVSLEGNNIVQRVEIPLYYVVAKGEKIRIETIHGKKYEAEINSPKTLTDLQFILQKEGILDEKNQSGNYIIKFDIVTPNLSSLKKEEREQFLSMLRSM